MIATVVFRYAGLGLQFVILSVLAHMLNPSDYGRYLVVLSVVLPTYFLLGLGASESFVREASRVRADEGPGRVRSLVGAVGLASVGSGLGLALATMSWILFAPGTARTTAVVVWFMLAFFVANGLMFNAAQILLATGAPKLGGFFFYPALNVCLGISSMPYVFLATHPTFEGMAVVTSVAGLVAALLAWGLVVARTPPVLPSAATLRRLVASGGRLAAARAMYSAGLWLPTFFAGLMLSPVDAGFLGTAGRLSVGVAAVTAAIRFSVRPRIVRQFAERDYAGIRRTCGALAFVASSLALIALAVSLTVGHTVVRLIFGTQFGPVAPLLSILLLGVMIESFGGPVDEVLKMTGHENWLLLIFAVALPSLAVALYVTSRISDEAMAAAQVGYFLVVLVGSLFAVRRSLGFWISPLLPSIRGRHLTAAGAVEHQ